MRFLYFDDVTKTVTILPDRAVGMGWLLGEVSDEDFAKIRTNFLVQALFNRAGIDRSAIDIQIVHGPSPAP